MNLDSKVCDICSVMESIEVIIVIRRGVSRFLSSTANILIAPNKFPKLLMWAAKKINPDPAAPPDFITIVPDRYRR